ncbi:MAG: hypothetical protein J1E38_02900 [Paramuribaculum sp.]|nr:hypothetical protein [Paramuribaculum sp.]
MNTKSINQKNNKKSDNDKLGYVATAAAAAGLGVAGTAMATNIGDELPTEDDEAAANIAAQGGASHAIHETETVVTETENVHQSHHSHHSSHHEETQEIYDETPSDTDELAQAILNEELVDPNDIDMPDVINFDEIGTIYTVNGESYTAATFHDMNGNEFALVDVDGDGVFDNVSDMNANPIDSVSQELLSMNDITVDDAEFNLMGDDVTYLAANDDIPIDEFGADSFLDDIIS